MTIEDRLRRDLQANHAQEPAGDRDWQGVRDRIQGRARVRRRLRWGALLLPVLIAGAGFPAFQAFSPAGHQTRVVVASPRPTAPNSPAVVQLQVISCPVQTGGVGATPPALPTRVTTTAQSGPDLSAYGGTMILLGPAGWDCQGAMAADGSRTLVEYPPGTPSPLDTSQPNTTQTVQVIRGYLPSPGTGALLPEACYFPESGGFCVGAPKGESRTRTQAGVIWLVDPPGVPGNGFLSGGPNPSYEAAFYRHLGPNPDQGKVSCTLSASQEALCQRVLEDFVNRYA